MSISIVYDAIDAQAPELTELSRTIWETPELGLHEERSAALLMEQFETAGFEVESGIGGMPTAFIARYGEGEPAIGILGEYDALPGLSQDVTAERDPIEEGGPGHGCGHNLFAVASYGASLGLKRAIDRGNLDGTIEFYGCPAEEILVGKVFMARDGAFDHLDAAITWHPGSVSVPRLGRLLALNSMQFTFEGESAHAAASPEAGRSALDAVELLNTGVEYMREHIADEARVHYVITDGGDAPNVVPGEATVWYYVRAPNRSGVDRISDWLADIAEAAATMTQTSVERRYITGCWDYLPNRTITDAIWETMQELGSVGYDEDDEAFAADLKETIPDDRIEADLEDVPDEHADAMRTAGVYDEPVPAYEEGTIGGGSSDVGDVSWITPVGQFRAATWAVGTPAHSWQAVAANGDFGAKGMRYAAKVLGGTAYKLFDDPALLERALEEFETVTEDRPYESPLPDDVTPPFDVTAD